VTAFHQARWKPKGAVLVVVGSPSLEQVRALAQTAFGSWSGAAEAPPAWSAAAPPYRGKIAIVDRPDAAQTYVVHILNAPPRWGEEYYAWRQAGEVLGAGASGRLYANLRQDKGYSYGASSSQWLSSGPLAWFAQGGVDTDKTKESLVEFVAEAKGIGGDKAITETELEDARLAWLRGYAAGFLTNLDVTRRVADLWARGWPMSLLAEEPALFTQTSLDDVRAAAKRYAVPAEATVLLVGDRGKIETGVRSLALGDVIVVDVEGKPTGQ
jgi:zinc protease